MEAMIVIVMGLPGSGKSYFAERLAKKIHAEYISSDRLRKELFATRTYSKAEKGVVYDEMLRKMEEAISQKKSAVLDATFYDKEIRDMFLGKAGKQVIIEVEASESLIKERLKQRRRYSEADFEVYKIIRGQWNPLIQPHLILESTNTNIEDMLAEAMEYLNNDTGADR